MARRRNNNKNGYKGGNKGGQRNSQNQNNIKPSESGATNEDFKGKEGRYCNDPSWYAANEQLLNDSASLAYSWPTGSPIDLGRDGNLSSAYSAVGDSDLTKAIPGIAVFKIVPTIGKATHQNAPVNVAMRNIYSWVRHANSGHSNYDAPDLMLYLLAMDNCYSYLSEIQRLYGILTLYSQVNRYYPQFLVKALGYDYDSFMSNLANFRYFINTFAVKVGSLAVPAEMPYYKRHVQMYTGIYMEEQTAKSQTYIYSPRGFYRFDELSGPGTLKWTPYKGASTAMTFEEVMEYGLSLINPILQSEDMNIMSGDILKAYGESQLWKVSTISENYSVIPEVNTEILSQMQNATVFASVVPSDITQVVNPELGGYLVSKPSVKMGVSGNNVYALKKFITFDHDKVTPGETMVASRLMAFTEKGSGQNKDISTCGTELVDTVELYTIRNLSDGTLALQQNMLSMQVMFNMTGADTERVYNLADTLRTISMFRYHPACVFDVFDEDAGTSGVSDPMLEIDNYAIIDDHTLSKMNETALLSLFSVKQTARTRRRHASTI